MPILVYVSKTTEIKWRKAIKALDRRSVFFRQELPRRISLAYYRMVMRNIQNQAFAGEYEPLSLKYAKSKRDKRFWIKSGNLVKVLSSMIPVKVADSTEYTEYMMKLPSNVGYAFFGEIGTKKMPARPVFEPTLRELEGVVKKETGYFLRQISLDWRL